MRYLRFVPVVIAIGTTLAGSDFSTFVAPGDAYWISRALVDRAGNTYIAGYAASKTHFSAAFAFPAPEAGSFVVKLDRSGKVVYERIIAGCSVSDLAVDDDGYAYLVGSSSRCDLPNEKKVVPWSVQGGFLVKLDIAADRIVYSTCFSTSITGIAVDKSRHIWLVGSGHSSVMLYANNCGSRNTCAFLIELPPEADRYISRDMFSGSQPCTGSTSSCQTQTTSASALRVITDPAGRVYVLWSGSGVPSRRYLKAGKDWTFSTTLAVADFAVDNAGNTYLVGSAGSGVATTPGVVQSLPAGGDDGYVTKLNPAGKVVWTTRVGGLGNDAANRVDVDAAGNVWVSGTTTSPDFPVKFGGANGGDFVVGLNYFASSFVFAGRFPTGTAGGPIAVDSVAMLRTTGPGGVVSSFLPFRMEPKVMGIANAAAGYPGGLVAPGELISIHGLQVGPGSPVESRPDASGLYPKTLGGVQVFIDGLAAPLLYVSESQINAVVPYGISTANKVLVRAVNGKTSLPDFVAKAVYATPEIFRGPNGTAILNQDGSPNSGLRPAKPGSIVSMWLTGGRAPAAPPVDGRVVTTASRSNCAELDKEYTVVYAGAAPGMIAGVCQINFVAPQVGSARAISRIQGCGHRKWRDLVRSCSVRRALKCPHRSRRGRRCPGPWCLPGAVHGDL